MQGRLVPKYQGRYQAHPVGYWIEEFRLAADLGLDVIEFIFDFNDAEINPLLYDPSIIYQTTCETGVGVKSICADYFMEAPLQREPKSILVLERLIKSAAEIGVRDIVIPCVDKSSLGGRADILAFITTLRPLASKASQAGVNLSLETDLAPQNFARLLEEIDCSSVGVNYDTGNSAALGYSPVEEFASYGTKITDVHIKDRVFRGEPVVLGEGDCDFETVFSLIAQSAYDGPLILQAYRDDEGVSIARSQKTWLEQNFGSILE